VLENPTHEQMPLDWATTQNNLGGALLSLGKRQPGQARLEEAIAAFRVALEGFKQARAELYISVAEANLARAEALLTEPRADRRKRNDTPATGDLGSAGEHNI
jgi:hypothetical protein